MTKTCSLIVLLFLLFIAPGILAAAAPGFDPTATQEDFNLYLPDHPPSETQYRQNGKPVTSLGVFEHWNNDTGRKYSRNLDPANSRGIELIYLPIS